MGVTWVARGNIQQNSYIPQTEQHSPFGVMLLRLGNVTIVSLYEHKLKNRHTQLIGHTQTHVYKQAYTIHTTLAHTHSLTHLSSLLL